MKRTTQILFIALAIFSTTIASAKEERKPLIKGVTYGQQNVVHYDNKRNYNNVKLKQKGSIKYATVTNRIKYRKKR